MWMAASVLLTGCASDGTGPFATGSLANEGDKTAAAKVNPACVELGSRIDSLRKEGTIGRLEKAADGKSSSVQVKRSALAKQAELNKAYAEYQDKCSTLMPRAQTAANTIAPTQVAAPANAAATTTPQQ